jgi:molecular chaperone DnaK (HSP70)
MKLGIDFGTTRTVVAVADRGNYPLVSFTLEDGSAQAWYPGLIAARGDRCAFGLAALEKAGEPGWTVLRSLKRFLMNCGGDAIMEIGEYQSPLLQLLTEHLAKLRRDIYERSNLELSPREPLQTLISIPANANSNQRFLTLEAFRDAGFRVLGMVNEPSAAGIEFAHNYAVKEGKKGSLVVYDLGGGTFDTSVIEMKERHYEVLTDEGIAQLGGDDFDRILLELTLEQIPDAKDLSPRAAFQLLEECRRQKEALHPNTRRMTLHVGENGNPGTAEVNVGVDEYYRRCAPLIEQTVQCVETAVQRAEAQSGIGWKEIAALYVVGGASDLPAVSRCLRERYGRRVRRSPYPSGSTAIGLAIAAESAGSLAIKERFARYFGVWREADGGVRPAFDAIFSKGTALPAKGAAPVQSMRRYHPAHNIAHFRYLECSHLSESGEPAGDVIAWDEIFFSADPALSKKETFTRADVKRTGDVSHQIIEEVYACDASGVIEVTIANRSAGYERTYRIRDVRPQRAQKKSAG